MNSSSFLIALFACIACALLGCSQKANAKSELEKAAAALEKSDPTPTAAQPRPPAEAAPINLSANPTRTAASPAQQMKEAIAAYKAGNLDDAVTRLQKLRAMPAMSPEQRIALNDAMAAVMTEIYTLAAKGDGRAVQAVKQYEQMQTRPR
jgi:hypothetical protein